MKKVSQFVSVCVCGCNIDLNILKWYVYSWKFLFCFAWQKKCWNNEIHSLLLMFDWFSFFSQFFFAIIVKFKYFEENKNYLSHLKERKKKKKKLNALTAEMIIKWYIKNLKFLFCVCFVLSVLFHEEEKKIHRKEFKVL